MSEVSKATTTVTPGEYTMTEQQLAEYEAAIDRLDTRQRRGTK